MPDRVLPSGEVRAEIPYTPDAGILKKPDNQRNFLPRIEKRAMLRSFSVDLLTRSCQIHDGSNKNIWSY